MKTLFNGISIIILILFLNIYYLGCSSSDNSNLNKNPGTNFVTGKILMVENEPFAKLALLSDSSVYLLDCPKGLKDTLYNYQGNAAKVFYDSLFRNEESIKVLKVNKVELLNNGSNDK